VTIKISPLLFIKDLLYFSNTHLTAWNSDLNPFPIGLLIEMTQLN